MVDVIIVGAGPAGLFAANELSSSSASVLVIDQGRDISDRVCPMKDRGHCLHCDPCHIMCGIGGAGTYSDGLLNLHPTIGGDLMHLAGDGAWDLINEVDSAFLKYGASSRIIEPSMDDAEMLKRNAAAAGARFVPIRQRHMGSDRTSEIIAKFKRDLEQKGIKFRLNSRVEDLIIEGDRCCGVKLADGTEIKAGKTLLALGRIGAQRIGILLDRYAINWPGTGLWT